MSEYSSSWKSSSSTECQEILASGEVTFPGERGSEVSSRRRNRYLEVRTTLTFSELGKEDRRSLRNESTLSSDTDASSDVVSTDDSLGDTSSSKNGDGSGSGRLELVLEDDETEELKTRLGLLSVSEEKG